MNVMVYDNQLAYYKLLMANFSDRYNFVLYNPSTTQVVENTYSVLMFFLYDEMELLDFIKLYNKNTPAVFATSHKDEEESFNSEGNIYYLHLDKLKDEIIEEAGILLKRITA